MDGLTPRRLVSEPDITAVPDTAPHPYRRALKLAGDVLWYAFMSVILGSVAVGLAARLIS